MKKSISKFKLFLAPLITLFGFIILLPTFHLAKTFFAEGDPYSISEDHYTDDASHLNKTFIDSLISIPNDESQAITQITGLIRFAKTFHKKISIAGSQHSMGGHTMTDHGILLNMKSYHKMTYDSNTQILTIGSGATWSEALQFLNKRGRSISIMQSFSDFTIGGSLSVNGHGWQPNAPPVSSSVISFTLLNAKGELITCSRNENTELFKLVIGGYGLFGVILNLCIKTVQNLSLESSYTVFKANQYLEQYTQRVDSNPMVNLAYGRLDIRPNHFLENATLNIYSTSNQKPSQDTLLPNHFFRNLKRLIFRSSVNSGYGKSLRWILETNWGRLSQGSLFTRNDLLFDESALIQNRFPASTDILHEYFIPRKHFYDFIEAIKTFLPDQNIDLLNITIRNVYPDHDAFLNYAREEVFAFVMLFHQQKSADAEVKMRTITKGLINATLNLGGTYYLPYRLHATKEQLEGAYPQFQDFLKLKQLYDPNLIFQNKFFENYGDF